jgi:hypothetical protein
MSATLFRQELYSPLPILYQLNGNGDVSALSDRKRVKLPLGERIFEIS